MTLDAGVGGSIPGAPAVGAVPRVEYGGWTVGSGAWLGCGGQAVCGNGCDAGIEANTPRGFGDCAGWYKLGICPVRFVVCVGGFTRSGVAVRGVCPRVRVIEVRPAVV